MEKEIKNTTPEIERCDFCGQLVFTAVACPWTGGAVHMTHCPECKYFEPMFWHCLYRKNDEKVVG
jgi:hypothetical protein